MLNRYARFKHTLASRLNDCVRLDSHACVYTTRSEASKVHHALSVMWTAFELQKCTNNTVHQLVVCTLFEQNRPCILWHYYNMNFPDDPVPNTNTSYVSRDLHWYSSWENERQNRLHLTCLQHPERSETSM